MRSHRAGHYSPIEETLALLAISTETTLAAILANHTSTINGAQIGPAAPVIFNAPAFTSKTGKVRVMVSVTTEAGTGTTVAGETLSANVNINALGAGVNESADATTTLKGATFSFQQDFTGLAIGVPITFGVQVGNVTTPAHTLTIPAGEAVIVLQDLP